MKKILSFLMALALSVTCLATFVGCGGDDYPEEKGATIIRMIALEMPDYQKKWYDDVAREFNENLNDGIQLKIIYETKANLSSSIATTLEGKEQTAIYWCSPGNLYGTFVKNGRAANVANYISKEAIADLTDAGKAAVTINDIMYAYPMYFEPSMMYFYNKLVFEEVAAKQKTNGVAVEDRLYNETTQEYNVPETWAELLATCAAIKQYSKYNGQGFYPISVPWGSALYWATTGMELSTTGETAIDDTWMNVNVDPEDEGWQAMTSFFWDIYMNGYAPQNMASQLEYDYIVEQLIKGQFATVIGYSAGMAEVNHQYGNSSKFETIGFAPMPIWENARNKDVAPSVNGGWTYVINSKLNSDMAKKAAKVIEFFSYEDPARTAKLFEYSAYSRVSPNTSVRDYMDTLTIDAKYDYRTLIQEIADKSIFAPHYSDAAQEQLKNEAYDVKDVIKEFKLRNGNAVVPSTDSRAITEIKAALASAKTEMQKKLNDEKYGYWNPIHDPANKEQA